MYYNIEASKSKQNILISLDNELLNGVAVLHEHEYFRFNGPHQQIGLYFMFYNVPLGKALKKNNKKMYQCFFNPSPCSFIDDASYYIKYHLCTYHVVMLFCHLIPKVNIYYLYKKKSGYL